MRVIYNVWIWNYLKSQCDRTETTLSSKQIELLSNHFMWNLSVASDCERDLNCKVCSVLFSTCSWLFLMRPMLQSYFIKFKFSTLFQFQHFPLQFYLVSKHFHVSQNFIYCPTSSLRPLNLKIQQPACLSNTPHTCSSVVHHLLHSIIHHIQNQNSIWCHDCLSSIKNILCCFHHHSII